MNASLHCLIQRKIKSVLRIAAIALMLSEVSATAQTPSFNWAKRIASTINPDSELAIGMANDSLGNLYVTGWFDGTNDFGGVTLTNKPGGGQDIFVGKYNSSGILQWARRAGGSTVNWDAGRGVGVDGSGNVYVTGGFYGTADFGSSTLTASQNQDFFLAKYNSAGAVQWVRQSAGGGHSAYGTGLAVDSGGNSYVVGYFDGASVTFGSTTLNNIGDYNVFLVKYDSAGTLQWAKAFSSPDFSYATSVALDGSGNVYVPSEFWTSVDLGVTNFASTGGQDGLVVKFNSVGTLQWARPITGASDAAAIGVTVDGSGNVFVVGGFGNSAGDTVSFGASVTLTNGGGGFPGAGIGDAFLAKYNSTGVIEWARRAGTTNLDGYLGVATDAQGNIYAGGGFDGTGLPAGFNAVVTKYDTNGAALWTQSSSGTNGALAWAGPVTDMSGNTYIAGWFQTNVMFGTNTLTGSGAWSFFLARLGANALTGSVQVTISPSNAVNAGAQWQVDSGAWQNSGDTVSGLTVENHTVAYKTITDWNTPSIQTVVVSAGGTTVTNGTYTPQTGSLQVTISPAGAVAAGAQWQVDSAAWKNSGATVVGLAPGSHTVAYKTISGWDNPSNQTVTITTNTTTMTNATYIQQTGALLVTISPSVAVSAGAQWQVDSGPWQNSGAVVSGLSPGNHMVAFNTITNWITPASQLAVVAANVTTTANGNYLPTGQPVFPAPIGCMLQGATFTMTYPTVPGQVYVLQYTDSLAPPVTWHAYLPFVGAASSPINIAVTTGGSPTRYFRIRLGDSLFSAVYSVNIVGYVRRSIQSGLNLVANPLNSCNGNSIGNLFQNCPESSEILLPDSNGSLDFESVFSGGMWNPPNLNLVPGQGVGFVNPGAAFEVTFGGEVALGALTRALPPGPSLISSVLPVNGLLNFPAQDGDEITTWNATNQTSHLYEYLGAAWQPASPAIMPGEAFWVQLSQFKQWTQPFEWWNDLEVWEFPVITGHPQSQTRVLGATAHFTASALGGLPLSYQWRKDGTNVLNGERVFGATSPTLAMTNAQPGDAGNYTVVITNTYGSATSHVAVLTVPLPPPEIITTNGGFGVSNGLFGFNFTGLSGQTVVIEGSSNLINWAGLRTNLLTGDTIYFSDPQWTNYSTRYYRIRSP